MAPCGETKRAQDRIPTRGGRQARVGPCLGQGSGKRIGLVRNPSNESNELALAMRIGLCVNRFELRSHGIFLDPVKRRDLANGPTGADGLGDAQFGRR